MKLLTRPRRVSGFGGFGADDLSDWTTDVPTTPNGAVDWGALVVPATGGFTAADFSLPIQAGAPLNLASIGKSIASGAQTWFGTQTAVNNASAATQLAKAQNQAAINIAKAGGTNAALTAGAGLPSPTLLLLAGLGLAAVVLMRK